MLNPNCPQHGAVDLYLYRKYMGSETYDIEIVEDNDEPYVRVSTERNTYSCDDVLVFEIRCGGGGSGTPVCRYSLEIVSDDDVEWS